MTEASASPVLETEQQISDKSPPKVLIQQPSESDNKSEENGVAGKDDQNGVAVNGLAENVPQEDVSGVQSEESQDKVDSNQASAELESVRDNQDKSSDTDIVNEDDKKTPNENNVEESNASNKPGDIQTTTLENADNNLDPSKESTETITNDTPLVELSRSRTPEIIITPTEDDTPLTNTALQENKTAESTDIASPTIDDSAATPSEAKIQDFELSQIETIEDKTNDDKTGSGSRPTSADRPKSKSPELPPAENDTEKLTEASKEESPKSESKPIEQTAGILELVTNQTMNEEEPHPCVSEDTSQTASNQETPVSPLSPVAESKESQSEGQENENPAQATTLGDDVTSVTSDEHGGTENPHKDGYDASVSGNEEESNDPPAYTPTVIENSMHEVPKQTELAVPVDTPTPTDVAATSSETLVPSSRPASSENRPRSPKSVKFSEDSNVHGDDNASTDGAKKLEDLRHSLQTPLPVIIKQGDLEMDIETEEVEEQQQASEEAADVGDEEIPASPPKVEIPEKSPTPLPSTPDKERELKVKIQELNVQIKELENKINDLEEEKSRVIEEKNSQIKQMKTDYEKKMKKLQSEKEDLEKKINEHENVVGVKDSEISTLKQEIQRQKNEINDYKTKVNKSKTCIIL